ncbi:helix-turn-helix domain-containing protein [Streptomyces sp. NPDC047841]|uniref:helix-turn-helix domain-containing protein n=1 Tax=Streptomyces sp. NPDC047841 TaxID=3154708 RepID=UPI003451DD46
MKTAPAGPHHAALAHRLQELRQLAGLTFAELAERTAALGDPALAVSAATLKRAAGCRTLPKQATVVAYARGCGATAKQEEEMLRLWARVRARDRGILRQLHAPAVHNIRTRREFTAALAAVYERAGAPPLRTVQQRAGTVPQPAGAPCESEVFLLPLGTLWRIANRQIKWPAWKHVEAFLRGCGITGERTLEYWKQAWKHALAKPATAAVEGLQLRDPGRRARAARQDTMKYSEVIHAMKGASAAPGPGSLDMVPSWRVRPLDPVFRRDDVLADLHKDLFGSARRNGLAPDTGIDAILVSADGSVLLVEMKQHSARPSRRSSARGPRRTKQRGRG